MNKLGSIFITHGEEGSQNFFPNFDHLRKLVQRIHFSCQSPISETQKGRTT